MNLDAQSQTSPRLSIGHRLPVPFLSLSAGMARAAPVKERAAEDVLKEQRTATRLMTAERGVLCLAATLSVGAYSWYASRGLILAYPDAVSHIMIARRVVDGRVLGIAQLGTVWLPLQHLLMLPLIWITPLFRNGFAGSFPSMVAYVITSLYLYRTGLFLFASRLAGWVAALVFMLNPSMLYIQATAMTESEMLCAATLAIYFALRWSHFFHMAPLMDDSHQAAVELARASVAIAAGTLIRYDAWFLALAAAMLVLYITWRKQGHIVAEAWMILFAGLAFAGCCAWFLYNWLIFRDPLAFYHNAYSALTQQSQLQAGNRLPTQGNLFLSMWVYAQATIDTVGLPLAALALLGFARSFSFRPRASRLPVYLVFSPFVFNVLSLLIGASVIETPEIRFGGITTYFNERYGLMMLPAFAIFLAFLAIQQRALLVAVIGTVIVFAVIYSTAYIPYALEDPTFGASAPASVQDSQAGQWLAAHYHGGHVLISYGSDAPMMFYSNLPESVFISDTDTATFRHALAQPQRAVSWIVMSTGGRDPIWVALERQPGWRRHFVLRRAFGTMQIYERVGSDHSTGKVSGN